MKKIRKNYKYLAVITCLTLILGSCDSDEFLEEKPRDTIFADNLFENKTGFMFAITALNRRMADERGATEITGNVEAGWIFKLGSDWGISNTAFSTGRAMAWYTNDLTPNFGNNRDVFSWLFQVINSSNLIISRAENPEVNWEGTTPEESEANKNYVIAHAKFAWTWAYRHLTYLYGDVPLSTEEIDGLNYRNDWNRESVANIRQKIEEYLLFAEEHLLDSSNDPTILTKAVARHYLSELYLALDDAAKAEQKALLVANDSQYSLITERYGVKSGEPGVPFMDQFHQGNVLRTQGNTEVLWAFITQEDILGGPPFIMRRTWMTRYDRGSGGIPISEEYGGRGLALAAISAYAFDVFDDDPSDDRFSEYAIRRYWVNPVGDTIFAQMDRDQEPTNSRRNNYEWSHTRKWDGVSADPNNVAGSYEWKDQPYLRLSETYLLLAEAQFKLGKTTEAAEWINKLRRRANTFEITGADVDIDFILDERTRELVTEEHRRHTLSRLGLLYERARQYNKGALDFMQPYHVLLPIPQVVIDANTEAVMEQNPGY